MMDGPEPDLPIGPWFKWSWTYGFLSVSTHNTLEAALATAYACQDDEHLVGIEGPDGRLVSREQIDADLRRREDEEKAGRARTPKHTHGVKLRGPWPSRNGPAWVETFTSREEADAFAARLREQFGDRVSVHKVGGRG